MTELDFLKNKGLIKEGFTKFTIKGDFGEIELTELLKEYKAEKLILSGVSGMFSAEKLEQAYEDGIESEEQRCGVFEIENYL